MNKKYSKFTGFLKYWKSISWAIFIALLLFTPGSKFPKQNLPDFEHIDKLVHLIIFGIFEFLLLYDGRYRVSSSGASISLTVIAVFFAFFTEGVQYLFVRERNASWQDLLADIAGCFLGILIFRLFCSIKGRFSLRN